MWTNLQLIFQFVDAVSRTVQSLQLSLTQAHTEVSNITYHLNTLQLKLFQLTHTSHMQMHSIMWKQQFHTRTSLGEPRLKMKGRCSKEA